LSRLGRYLVRLYLVRLAVVLLAVTGFALVFDLLDMGPRVIRRAGGSTWALLAYVPIRLPTLLSELLPMAVLLAGLLTVTDLLRFRELVATWGAGVSRLDLVVRLWPAALLVLGGKFLLDDLAVPATVPALRAMGVADFKTVGLRSNGALWVRTGDDVVRIPSDAAAMSAPRDLLILRLDPQGRLVERIEAAAAEPGPEGWLLREVVRRPAAARPAEQLPELFWPVRLDLEQVALMAKLPRELSMAQLWRVIRADGFGVGGTEEHRTWLQARLAGLLALWATVVLPFALARRLARVGETFALFAKGLAIGFVHLIANGLLLAFGELGLLAPAVAAWTAPLVFASFVLVLAGLFEQRRGRPLGPPLGVVGA